MIKPDFQKELLEKIKQGVKPSDLKKKPQAPSQTSTPASSPPASPLIGPIDKKDQQKHDQGSISPPPIVQGKSKKIQQLQEQVDFWSQTAQTHLTNLQRATAQLDQAEEKIKELETKPTQLSQETEQALKEANQRIREQEQIIKDLQNQAKSTTNKQTKTQSTQTPQPKHYLFTCDICQQNKKSQLHLARVNGLGIDPHKQNKICDSCIRKVDLIQERKEDFF